MVLWIALELGKFLSSLENQIVIPKQIAGLRKKVLAQDFRSLYV